VQGVAADVWKENVIEELESEELEYESVDVTIDASWRQHGHGQWV